LNAVGWLNINSTFSLFAPGHCFTNKEANTFVFFRLKVYQGAPGGGTFELQNVEPQLHEQVKAGCTSVSKAGLVDDVDERTLSLSDVPINAGSPIIASVEMMLQAHASSSGANATINSSGSLGITVPSIWLIIDH
jgi:hypothetical protein